MTFDSGSYDSCDTTFSLSMRFWVSVENEMAIMMWCCNCNTIILYYLLLWNGEVEIFQQKSNCIFFFFFFLVNQIVSSYPLNCYLSLAVCPRNK